MHGFSEHQLLGAFLAIATVLLVARGMAELCRRLGQPEVLGELLGGFLLGPSILGALFPQAYESLFLNLQVSMALQLMSWIGAILLLMIAGMEADLAILRQKVVPGSLAAAGAILASIGVGTLLGSTMFHLEPTSSVFLGLVLSVTAVSVVAKLLIEREALRRDYAQVMLAAGIAGEVAVWPLISIVSSVQHRANPWVAGFRAGGWALLFMAVMFTGGRRVLHWAMRRVADATAIPNGELSLVLMLLCVSAATTTLMGLHPLLGAFIFGVLLGPAPRATVQLKERIQAITIAIFAPIFFGLAGMRVNLFALRGWGSLKAILVVLVVAGVAKMVFGALGAAAGKLPAWEAVTVGVGLSLKGGTDVVVAIVGTELLLLTSDLYTVYAVVAILTVVVTPPLLNWASAKTTPGEAELKRLNREEARKLAYLADRERVLLPLVPELLPALSAQVISAIARAKHQEGELFDMTELTLGEEVLVTSVTRADLSGNVVAAASVLSQAADMEHVGLQRVTAREDSDLLPALQAAAEGQHLVAIGAKHVSGSIALSFGTLQDRVLREIGTDVLVVISGEDEIPRPKRILVPVNGLSHALDAVDVAAYLAKGSDAEVTVLAVVTARLGPLFWRERKHRDLLQAGYTITREAKGRAARLEVRYSEQVVLAADAAEAVLAELQRQPYDLLMLGGVMRSSAEGISLGKTIEQLLPAVRVPSVLLVSRSVTNAAG